MNQNNMTFYIIYEAFSAAILKIKGDRKDIIIHMNNKLAITTTIVKKIGLAENHNLSSNKFLINSGVSRLVNLHKKKITYMKYVQKRYDKDTDYCIFY